MAPTAEEMIAMVPTAASPTREPSLRDVDHYLRLRAESRRLNHDLLAIVPPHAMDHIGAAIGILCGRTFFFETESVAAVLADCCIFDWLEDGGTAPERYARETPPLEGTYGHELLEAMLCSRYDIVDVVERRPGIGLLASSLVDGKDVRVLDVDLGRRTDIVGETLTVRLLPMWDLCMTSAPAIVIARPLAVAALRTFARTTSSRVDESAGPLDDHELVLTIVRAGLEARHGRRSRSAGAIAIGRTA
jgi:hypothetical protein